MAFAIHVGHTQMNAQYARHTCVNVTGQNIERLIFSNKPTPDPNKDLSTSELGAYTVDPNLGAYTVALTVRTMESEYSQAD